MGDLVEVVSGDLLEIVDASEKEGQVQMVKCKGKSEIIQEGDFNGIGIRGRIDSVTVSLQIGRTSISGFTREECFWEFEKRIKYANCIG